MLASTPTQTGSVGSATTGRAAATTQASHHAMSMKLLSVVTKRFSIMRRYWLGRSERRISASHRASCHGAMRTERHRERLVTIRLKRHGAVPLGKLSFGAHRDRRQITCRAFRRLLTFRSAQGHLGKLRLSGRSNHWFERSEDMQKLAILVTAIVTLAAGSLIPTRAEAAGCYRWGETGYHWYRYCAGPRFLYPHRRVCRHGRCWYR
jgi:hypothetical protein